MITRNRHRAAESPGMRWDHIRIRMLSFVWLLIILTGMSYSQDFENHGTLTNRGLFRIKDKAVNLPDSVGGFVEYKGADQLVPSRTYVNLLLTGRGVKSTSVGNFTVRNTVQIDSTVQLTIDSSSILTLQGSLKENGYLSGSIQNTQVLKGVTASSDFGGIGAQLSWNGTAPDTTVVTRTSGTSLHAKNNNSIKRFYLIRPKVNTNLDATFVFHYNANELIGQNASKLVLWNSTDGGTSWKAAGGVNDTVKRTIKTQGITSFGLWTASDSVHPMGEYRIAKYLVLSAGNKQTAAIRTKLVPFVVSIIAADSIPMQGQHVTFAITTMPHGALGGTISVTDTVTDANGLASCSLTLGDKIGDYVVTATAIGLSGSPLLFTARAISGPPAVLALVSGDNQSQRVLSTLPQPFIVTVRDSGNNPITNATIRYTIDQFPTGSGGSYLSTAVASTDANGRSSVYLTLGNKKGRYSVTATIDNFAPVRFIAKALPGVPALFALSNGDHQQARINSAIPLPLSASVVDSFGNGVDSIAVHFAITQAPASANGQILNVANAKTDSNGVASTVLKLGNKVGTYSVTATPAQFPNFSIVFNERAGVGSAAVLALTSGNSLEGNILDTLAQPLTVTLADSGGNLIPGDTVQFAITGTPPGASRQALSIQTALTDTAGSASSILRLGNKGGDYVVTISSPSLAGHKVQVLARAKVMLADANNDQAVNIADLTTLIDASDKKIILTESNFIRADINGDAVVDHKDVDTLVNDLLGGIYDGVNSSTLAVRPDMSPGVKNGSEQSILGIIDSSVASGEFELTSHGMRFNMTNTIAIRGIQLILRMHSSVNLSKTEIFDRAGFMKAPIHIRGNLLRIVVYNNANSEITTGSGSIFRLPVEISDLSQFDIVDVIISDHENQAHSITATKSTVIPGKYPESFSLAQNYPNPFNLETKIEYQVPDKSGKFVSILLQVFDLSGRKIKTLVKGDHESGHYSATWNGTNEDGNVVSSGVYLIRLWSPGQMIVKKMLLTK